MKLGLAIEYAGRGVDVPIERIRRCEALGYDSVWSAEAYGSDAITPLAFVAAHTKRIRLGTGVMQVAARSPAMAAMQLGTLDALAGGGRVIGGFGVSGPQIVEGWYGAPWGDPKERMRDYVAILHKIFAREAPVEHDGKEIQLPYRGPGALGQGKALKSIMHPNPNIEIWVASGGPLNTQVTAELADGWLPMGLGPNGMATYRAHLDKGFARRTDGRPRERFEIFTGLTVQITDDVRGTIEASKPLIGMYVGGMGSATHNYHREAMARRGFPEAAARIHELWLAGKKQEAVAAVPDEYIEQGHLMGSPDRIRSRWPEVTSIDGPTGWIVRCNTIEELDLAAELGGTRDEVSA